MDQCDERRNWIALQEGNLDPREASAWGKAKMHTSWAFDMKISASGVPIRFKALLVARRFTEKAGIDYGEICAPEARYSTVRILCPLISFQSQSDYVGRHVSISKRPLKEEVNCKQPDGFVKLESAQSVHRLLKAFLLI